MLPLEQCPLSPRTLKRYEVYALAAMYWPGDQIENAVNVAWEESGFRTHARRTIGEDSRGPWQINVAEGAHPGLAQYNLYDPQINAYWAHQIWLERGWRPWFNAATKLGLI